MSFEFHDIPNFRDVIGVYGRVPRHNLHFVNSTLDTCEGMGLMRTVDRFEARIMFWIEPDYWNDFVDFTEDMRDRVGLEINSIVNSFLLPANAKTIPSATFAEDYETPAVVPFPTSAMQ